MDEQELLGTSIFDVFETSLESFEEAQLKSAQESGSERAKFLSLKEAGTYTVRILPLAPYLNEDGSINVEKTRKGFEYPLKSLTLKIKGLDKEGLEKNMFVSVPHTQYAFPDYKGGDLIDTYVARATELYSTDNDLCDKLRKGSFEGGLKYGFSRAMYVYDLDNVKEGMQILQLSYSQYKDLEERKLNVWKKLNKNGNVKCPISSIKGAYPVEITKAKEGKKITYSFNIDIVSGVRELSEDELKTLLDAQRLPDTIYHYGRFHYEATIEFLNQCDKTFGISVMNDEQMKASIASLAKQIPLSDTSHFKSFGSSSNDEGEVKSDVTIESLLGEYEGLLEDGIDDYSDEGQNLRTEIKEFIQDNDLDVRVSRKKTNGDLLKELHEVMSLEVPQSLIEEDEEDLEESDERTERNDDTNEPAVRRAARPDRRR